MTKHRPQTPIRQSACLEAIQHLEMPADSPDQTIQQHPFPSLSTSNTHSSVHPLLAIMLPLKTDCKKSVYRTYGLASLQPQSESDHKELTIQSPELRISPLIQRKGLSHGRIGNIISYHHCHQATHTGSYLGRKGEGLFPCHHSRRNSIINALRRGARPYSQHHSKIQVHTVLVLRGLKKGLKRQKAKKKRKTTLSAIGPRTLPGPTTLQSLVQCRLRITPTKDSERRMILKAARKENPGPILRVAKMKLSRSNTPGRMRTTFSQQVWSWMNSKAGNLYLQKAQRLAKPSKLLHVRPSLVPFIQARKHSK